MTCSTCNGTGTVLHVRATGKVKGRKPCPTCGKALRGPTLSIHVMSLEQFDRINRQLDSLTGAKGEPYPHPCSKCGAIRHFTGQTVGDLRRTDPNAWPVSIYNPKGVSAESCILLCRCGRRRKRLSMPWRRPTSGAGRPRVRPR